MSKVPNRHANLRRLTRQAPPPSTATPNLRRQHPTLRLPPNLGTTRPPTSVPLQPLRQLASPAPLTATRASANRGPPLQPEPEPPEPESSSDGFEEEEEEEAEASGVSEGGLGPSGNAARERLPRAGPVARGRASHKRLRDVGWLAADPLGKGFIAPPRVAPLPAPRLPTLPLWHATLPRGLLDWGRALCRQLWTNPATTRHRATRSAPLTAEPGAQLALDPRGEKSSTAQLWQQLTR